MQQLDPKACTCYLARLCSQVRIEVPSPKPLRHVLHNEDGFCRPCARVLTDSTGCYQQAKWMVFVLTDLIFVCAVSNTLATTTRSGTLVRIH